MIFNLENSLDVIYQDVITKIELLWPKILWALLILIIGWIVARITYLFLVFFFKKIKLNDLVDKLKISFDEEKLESEWKNTKNKKKEILSNRFTDKIKVDSVMSKAIWYYIFLVFFRLAISYIGIKDVEDFMKDVIEYLPNLFIWIVIWFFGIRFANFIYDVVFHALSISHEKTAKIIAEAARIIILFFTLMVFLEYTKIVSMFIINTILIGFVSMISIAGWIAFWLWWKETAKDILETFKKD